MCGIAGFSGALGLDLLTRMNGQISHRGPDDSGVCHLPAKGIGLAHRRLSIIDLSPSGHQPMWDVTKRAAIVFNGEIYNYRELHQELEAEGFGFKSSSDTEVLLNLYLRDGEEMLPKLNGMFAFAIWDAPRNRLFLARDGVGVKPLYYAETPKGFLFASELKSLLEEPTVGRSLDPDSVFYHLIYLWCPAPHTMLQSVKKLEPGHAMIVEQGKLQKSWRFYQLPYDLRPPVQSVSEALDQVTGGLREAVRRQLVADVSVGAFLSGGLDSSLVVAMVKELLPDAKLQCFTIGFRDQAFAREGQTEDLPYAQRVAAHLKVDLHTITVGSEMIQMLEQMLYHLDEPQADPAALHVYLISQLARQHGIKVLLSGTGGDDIFSGYRRHYALAQEQYWSWIPRLLRQMISQTTSHLPTSPAMLRRVSKAFQYAHLDGNERIASYFYWLPPAVARTLCGPALRDCRALRSPSSPPVEALRELFQGTDSLTKMLFLDAKFFLTDHNLNYTDKMSMAAGVEVRVPYLDPDLMSVAARLPSSFKQHRATGKWILKKVAEPYLPHDVIYRSKTGFGAPMRQWIKHDLVHLVDDLFSSKAFTQRGLFDPTGVRQLVDLNRADCVDASYSIFAIMCIEIWCRLFVDGKAVH